MADDIADSLDKLAYENLKRSMSASAPRVLGFAFVIPSKSHKLNVISPPLIYLKLNRLIHQISKLNKNAKLN